jgi:hypothetical protein
MKLLAHELHNTLLIESFSDRGWQRGAECAYTKSYVLIGRGIFAEYRAVDFRRTAAVFRDQHEVGDTKPMLAPHTTRRSRCRYLRRCHGQCHYVGVGAGVQAFDSFASGTDRSAQWSDIAAGHRGIGPTFRGKQPERGQRRRSPMPNASLAEAVNLICSQSNPHLANGAHWVEQIESFNRPRTSIISCMIGQAVAN